jgi:hypothetical protein
MSSSKEFQAERLPPPAWCVVTEVASNEINNSISAPTTRKLWSATTVPQIPKEAITAHSKKNAVNMHEEG